MAEQLHISLVELFLGVKRPGREANHSPHLVPRSRMRGAIPPLPQFVFMAWCLVKHRDNFTFLQLIHEAYGDDAMRRAAVFKSWNRFRDGKTNAKGHNRLFHYPPEACAKRSAARFREVGRPL
jgi:hypothetical protein